MISYYNNGIKKYQQYYFYVRTDLNILSNFFYNLKYLCRSYYFYFGDNSRGEYFLINEYLFNGF